MPTLTPIAGCPLVTLAPEPCAPTWPTDPVGLGPVAVGARGVIPLTDPPFTASHWVSRAGMTNPGGGIIPTRHWIEFKGDTYIAYQGQYGNVGGVGPVPMVLWAGIIARTADGATWTTAFDGTGAPTSSGYLMPGMLFVRGEYLYCVIYKGGFSWVQPWAYLGPGEIAIWRTDDGLLWEKHQVLVSWPAAGAGENVGGVASGVGFRSGAQTVWRAAGSGPSGETADWLVVTYEAGANVPVTPVYYHGAPQYRSLDNGETWTFVRDMQGNPYSTSGADGPDTIFPVPRPGVATDRWAMLQTGLYSDNSGVSWSNTSNPHGVWPEGGVMVPSGGIVYTRTGGTTTGPSLWLSCDYAQSMLMPPGAPGGTNGGVLDLLPFGPTVAGGEELLAVTGQGAHLWHSTNGGETWADRGAVPVGFFVNYGLARAPNGRVLLFVIGGGGASMDLWTCDDEPTGIATPRSICPFEVDIGAPVGAIAGCASLTFITELCHALPPPPVGPGFETCAAPLGLFVLGEHCLGPLEVSPTAARRVPRRWSHAHAQ